MCPFPWLQGLRMGLCKGPGLSSLCIAPSLSNIAFSTGFHFFVVPVHRYFFMQPTSTERVCLCVSPAYHSRVLACDHERIECMHRRSSLKRWGPSIAYTPPAFSLRRDHIQYSPDYRRLISVSVCFGTVPGTVNAHKQTIIQQRSSGIKHNNKSPTLVQLITVLCMKAVPERVFYVSCSACCQWHGSPVIGICGLDMISRMNVLHLFGEIPTTSEL